MAQVTETPRRVVFLFGHLHKGGMQKAVSNLSGALPGHIEQYVVYCGTEDPGFPYRARMVDLQTPGEKGGTPLHKARNALRRLRRLQTFIDAEQIDTVVSFGETASVLNALTRRKRTVLSVRVAVSESLASLGTYGRVYKGLVRWLYRRADAVVPVSEGIAQDLCRNFRVPRRKITTIYNLYPIETIQSLAAAPLPPEIAPRFERPTVVTVGSLCYQKGQEHLIRAFAQARRRIPDLQLCLVGRGALQEAYTDLAERLGVGEAVLFTGFDQNPYRYLSRVSVFALTSRFEGFPNALAEAMICGLPVIATDCPTGPREILGESEHGILLPNITAANQAEIETRLAEAIVRLTTTGEGCRYREKARLRSHDFCPEAVLDRWLRVMGVSATAPTSPEEARPKDRQEYQVASPG